MPTKTLVCLWFASLTLIGCGDSADTETVGEDTLALQPIADIASGNDNLTTLTAALEAADLVDTLMGEGPFTVFAPTDEAFAALSEGTLEGLLADPDRLREILLYHVVPGRFLTEDVLNASTLTTALGPVITVQSEGPTLNEIVGFVETDIAASNGVVHVIDAVLMPPEMSDDPTIVDIAAEDGRFTTLVQALEAADLVDTLSGDGPFTVFAPTDDAFAALPDGVLEGLLADPAALTDILLYHVVSGDVRAETVVASPSLTTVLGPDIEVQGEQLRLNDDVHIIQTDIVARNGVIHVIDAVLMPPPESQTIVDIAAGNPDFSILVEALVATGLDETLRGVGPFTVFAPTNAAFEALPEGTLESLLGDTETLTSILLYHVVAEALTEEEVLSKHTITTVQTSDITVQGEAHPATLNEDVGFVQTDIMADNGIIHAIDAVLMPPQEMTVVDLIVGDGRFTTLVDALGIAGLVEALQGEGPFTVFAPTDKAFAKLDPHLLQSLLHDPPALADILLYHVASGSLSSEDVLGAHTIETLLGPDIRVTSTHPLKLNRTVGLIDLDLGASNGVVHVIDEVLTPPPAH